MAQAGALTIVLPIFNEELNLGPLFDRIDAALKKESLVYRIVAVDDGSTDRTAAVIESYMDHAPLQVVRHPVNQGLGVAIRSGLMEALRTAPADGIIVTMDADESHTPALIARMLEAIGDGYDVVIASRFQPGSETIGVPLHRRLLSVAASVVFRLLFPTPGVRDFTCGYRAYRASALATASKAYGDSLFEFEGFQCMVDLLLKLRATGARFTEAPSVLRYDLKQGQSKMRIVRTATRTLHLLIKRRLGF
ncbi:MAG: glycosyltransferase family 2 protein [Acidobacteria bacterium]|nr:glycosyltransferase family 2 protein [Acidobacteriota bacterium]